MRSPYKVFLLDKDGNTLWEHSQAGPTPERHHPYMISTMSVAISNDASYIAAGYGTDNSGVQLFKGKINMGYNKKITTTETKEKTTTIATATTKNKEKSAIINFKKEEKLLTTKKISIIPIAITGIATIATIIILIILYKKYKGL